MCEKGEESIAALVLQAKNKNMNREKNDLTWADLSGERQESVRRSLYRQHRDGCVSVLSCRCGFLNYYIFQMTGSN